MKKNEPINTASLIISLITLVIGVILTFNGSELIFKMIGYIISGLLLFTGVIKLIIAIVTGKKRNSIEFMSIFSSIGFIILGTMIAIYPSSIMITFSLIIGALALFIGVQRLILGLAVKTIDKRGSWFYIGESLLLVLLGVLVITQKFVNLIGVFLIIYSVCELAGYIYYKIQDNDYSEVLNKKVPKEMKEKEAKDAVIEE